MIFIDKAEVDAFDDKIMEAFITKTKQSEAKIGELEQNLKVKEAELEYIAKLYDNDKSTKNWVEAAVMALYNKIELEDGLTQSKKEIITNIVLSVLNKSDFQ